MATPQHIAASTAPVLAPVPLQLAAPAGKRTTTFEHLPFVRTGRRGRRTVFWACPASKGYTEDVKVGTLFAAAVLEYVSGAKDESPLHVLLPWIALDMAKDAERTRGFIVGFMSVIGVYLQQAVSMYTAGSFKRYVVERNRRADELLAALPAD